jgi:FkbM family methyltransferase
VNLFDLASRFLYKLHHITDFPRGNLLGSLLNMSRRGLTPARAIDVGANRARWSRDLRRVFPHCECLLVEPQIELAPYLDRFCRRNPGCQWICAGAGEAEGELPFTVRPDDTSSSFAISAEAAAQRGFERRVVPVVTLDKLCRDYFGGAAPEIVKVDAECFESQVIRGAKSLFGRTQVFFLETHFFGPETEHCGIVSLTAAMHERGYVPYDFTWFGKRPYDGAVGLIEIAYVQEAGMLRAHNSWSKPRKKAA